MSDDVDGRDKESISAYVPKGVAYRLALDEDGWTIVFHDEADRALWRSNPGAWARDDRGRLAKKGGA